VVRTAEVTAHCEWQFLNFPRGWIDGSAALCARGDKFPLRIARLEKLRASFAANRAATAPLTWELS
jgi:hypothetical protein